jgi:mitochondrial fission process protein 1
MWPWSNGGGPDKPPAPAKESPRETHAPVSTPGDVKKTAAEFDPKKLPEREKLPPKLQKIIDQQDKDDFFDDLVEG